LVEVIRMLAARFAEVRALGAVTKTWGPTGHRGLKSRESVSVRQVD